jgi:hypothetical protein
MSADRDRLSTGSDQVPEGGQETAENPYRAGVHAWRES